MTAPVIWPLAADPLPPAPSLGLVPGTIQPRYLTRQYLLDLFERILPASYLDPLRTIGPGYELLQAYATMWERVSLAIGRLEAGNLITLSHGGARATVRVEFYRDSGTAGSVTVRAGTLVSASDNGAQFVTLADAAFAGSSIGPAGAPAIAMAEGWLWNVPGQTITPRGEVLPGAIDRVDLPLQDPVFGDPTIRVRSIEPAVGGQPAMLDLLGHDRGVERTPGEDDDHYRVRIRTLPDVVTPDAIRRVLNRYLAQVLA